MDNPCNVMRWPDKAVDLWSRIASNPKLAHLLNKVTVTHIGRSTKQE